MSFERPSTPEESEGRSRDIVYETKKVLVPEKLQRIGYEGEASVQVEKSSSGKGGFSVRVEAQFKEGADAIGLVPTTRFFNTEEEAREEAERMIDDIENWEDYN